MWKNKKDHYALGIIIVHWLTLLLLVATYGFTLASAQALEGSEFRESLQHWHYVSGMLVLPAVAVRLVLRAIGGRTPSISPPVDPWLRRASQAFHALLIVFLIALPVLGWLTLSADGHDIPWGLPSIWPQSVEHMQRFEQLHVWIGEAGYYLIGIHAVAALAHHYIIEDDTLKRMLPRAWFDDDTNAP